MIVRLTSLAALALLLASCATTPSPAKAVTASESTMQAMKNPALRPYRIEVEAAIGVLDEFMRAFNARDVQAYDATFNFPSVRLASNTLRMINAGDHQPSMFETGSLAIWDHSAWQKREVLHAGPDKVHIDTRFARYRKDGSLIGGFDSIYIVTKENGRWGIKIRSSFAP